MSSISYVCHSGWKAIQTILGNQQSVGHGVDEANTKLSSNNKQIHLTETHLHFNSTIHS